MGCRRVAVVGCKRVVVVGCKRVVVVDCSKRQMAVACCRLDMLVWSP